MTRVTARFRVAAAFVAAARVALGILWLNEGITKYRAGFGAADIELVVQSATGNTRVPEFFMLFAEQVRGGLAGMFGLAMPLIEVGLGVALVLGVLTLPAAVASVGTLMTYWLADQLTGQYPVMVALAVVVILWPRQARHYGLVVALARVRARRGADRATVDLPVWA